MGVFKEKASRKLLLGTIIIGFLFVFFYQALVRVDFVPVNFKASVGSELDTAVILLSGWTREQKEGKPEDVWSRGRKSALAFFLPKKETYELKFELSFPDNISPEERVAILVNKHRVTTLRPKNGKRERGNRGWKEFSFIVPTSLVSKGYNKIQLVRLSGSSEPVGFRPIKVRNYLKVRWAFPRGYLLLNKQRWLSKSGGGSINWVFCFFGAMILPIIWMGYSAWFSSVSRMSFVRSLRLGWFTYLPSLILILLVYLVSRVFFFNLISLPGDFLLIALGLVGISKAGQLFRYAQGERLLAQAGHLKSFVLDGSKFIVGFMVLLIGCAVLLIVKKEAVAAKVADWAYLLLVIGVILKLIGLRRQGD